MLHIPIKGEKAISIRVADSDVRVGHGEQARNVLDDPAGVRGGRARRSADALGNMITRTAMILELAARGLSSRNGRTSSGNSKSSSSRSLGPAASAGC